MNDNINQLTEQSKRIIIFKNIIEKVKNVWLKLPEKPKKILKTVALVFGVMIFLIIIIFIILKFTSRTSKPINLPSPSFEPFPTGDVITNPSHYATDSGVIKIEKDLKSLEKDLDIMQINETSLLPPKLDFDINFNQ